MYKIKDMALYESARKCPHCGKTDTLKKEVGGSNDRWTHFVCDECKHRFVYKANWSYYFCYALAFLVAEVLYLLVLSPSDLSTAVSAIIMILVLIVLREVFTLLLFTFFGVCRLTEVKK